MHLTEAEKHDATPKLIIIITSKNIGVLQMQDSDVFIIKENLRYNQAAWMLIMRQY